MAVLFLVRKYIPLKPQFDFAYWKKFLREAAPLGISAIVVFAYFKMDTILLSVLKTNAEVGIYNAAYKVIENISFFPLVRFWTGLPGSPFDVAEDYIHEKQYCLQF